MTSINSALVSNQTLQWVKSFIIEYNICPFAKHVVHDKRLHLSVCESSDLPTILEALMHEVERLDNNPQIDTTLFILPCVAADFNDYLDLVDLAEGLMSDQEYEGIYQLATFHPQYCFEGVVTEDVSNCTNQSPYPMLHLLREDSIDKALEFYGNTDKIPEDNIKLMRELGLNKIKKILQHLPE